MPTPITVKIGRFTYRSDKLPSDLLLCACEMILNAARRRSPHALKIVRAWHDPHLAGVLLSPEPRVNRIAEWAFGKFILAGQDRDLGLVKLLVAARLHEIARLPGGGDAALHAMVMTRFGPGVDALLEAGADVAGVDDAGQTALHCAAYTGNAELVGALLAHGAPINARDYDRMTALHYAVQQSPASRLNVARLVAEGADLTARTSGGETPEDIARRRGNRDAADYLASRVAA